jgi:hypothetical protein
LLGNFLGRIHLNVYRDAEEHSGVSEVRRSELRPELGGNTESAELRFSDESLAELAVRGAAALLLISSTI